MIMYSQMYLRPFYFFVIPTYAVLPYSIMHTYIHNIVCSCLHQQAMEYLEVQRIPHGSLSARNVLGESVNGQR